MRPGSDRLVKFNYAEAVRLNAYHLPSKGGVVRRFARAFLLEVNFLLPLKALWLFWSVAHGTYVACLKCKFQRR